MDFGFRAGDGLARSPEDPRAVRARLEDVVPRRRGSADGTPDDPRFVLIGVDIHAAVFLEVNKPQPVVLFELVKGWLIGTEPELGKMHTLKP